jgi:hypothetical protein
MREGGGSEIAPAISRVGKVFTLARIRPRNRLQPAGSPPHIILAFGAKSPRVSPGMIMKNAYFLCRDHAFFNHFVKEGQQTLDIGFTVHDLNHQG